MTSARTGGDLVVESLAALGTNVAFGVPGTHTLAIWEALRKASSVRSGCGPNSTPASLPTATRA
jgi:acetolactate synthase-1/2/3 large subunit